MRAWFRKITYRLFDNGYFRMGKWSGIPIQLHWTAIVGALVFGRFEWAPAYWFAFIFVIAIHEMGHAVLVRRFGAMPISLDIHGLGGLCSWRGNVAPIGVATIAWGGVAAQFILCIFALIAIAVFGAPSTPTMMQLRTALIEQNLFLIALNLIPVPPLDGSKAWLLPGLLIMRWMDRRKVRKRENARRDTIKKLRKLDAADRHLRLVKSDVDEILQRAVAKSPEENENRRK